MTISNRENRQRSAGASDKKEECVMPLAKDDVAFLESIDTATVCNVIEIVSPERRGHGYTTRHLHRPFPDPSKTVSTHSSARSL
jgi:hypothetical protein